MAAFWVEITEKGGKPRREAFEQNEVTIGRVQGNDIVLPKGNISKRHSRVVLRDGKFIIVDLRSTNGTYVNGKRISSPQVLKAADKVYIGDFTLQVEPDGAEEEAAPQPTPQPAPPPSPPDSGSGQGGAEADIFGPDDDDDDDDDDIIGDAENMLRGGSPPPPEPAPPAPPPAERAPAPRKKKQRSRSNGVAPPTIDLPAAVLDARRAAFEAVRGAVEGANSSDPRSAAKAAAAKTLEALRKKQMPGGVNLEAWMDEIVEEVCGQGAISQLLDDDRVIEIFINGPHRVFVTRDGEDRRPEPVIFSSPEALSLVINRALRSTGARLDVETPIAEGRMADGTRINAVHQSLAVSGPVVTITRQGGQTASLEELIDDDIVSAGMAEFLETCVRNRRSIVVCGVPGSGLEAMVGALAAKIPSFERVVAVEYVSELNLAHPGAVVLEAKSPSQMRDVVSNALRMRPDRMVVHEMSGAEAVDVLLAMGSSQDGSLISTYAASAQDCLTRLAHMMTMGGPDLPPRAARQQIADSVDLVVCLTRFSDGREKVTEIVEVTGADIDLFTTQDIFAFKRDGGGGRFVAKGEPRFYEELRQRGEQLNMAIFREGV